MSFACRGLTHCSECRTPLGMNRIGTCESCEEKLKKKKQNKEKFNISKADEMFEKLGYRKVKRHVAYIKEQDFILFINKKQGVCIHKESSEYPAFTMKELKAINEKVKELRMEQLDNKINK